MQNKKQATIFTVKYSAIQGAYWPINCAIVSFSSVFLLSRNYTNSQIGIVLALANILAVFLQPVLATFADTTTKISLKNLMVLISLIAAGGCAVISFLPMNNIVLGGLLVFVITLLFTLQPLTNALGMDLVNRRVPINFGLARGIGSFSFAVFSYIIGYVVNYFGPSSTQIMGLLLYLLFALLTFTFYNRKSQANMGKTQESEDFTEKALGFFAFITKYKRFMLLLLAVSLTFSSHMLLNNYLKQIISNVGGDTGNMGTAFAVAAVVELPAMALFTPLVKKVKCSLILGLSFFFFVIKAFLAFVAPNVLVLYVSQIMQFFSYAFFIPASIYYVNQTISKSDLVKGQAFMTGAITVGGVAASLLGGVLLDGPGVRTTLLVGTVACLLGFLISLTAIDKNIS